MSGNGRTTAAGKQGSETNASVQFQNEQGQEITPKTDNAGNPKSASRNFDGVTAGSKTVGTSLEAASETSVTVPAGSSVEIQNPSTNNSDDLLLVEGEVTIPAGSSKIYNVNDPSNIQVKANNSGVRVEWSFEEDDN